MILYATSFCEHIWQCHCQCHSSRGQNLLVLILILQRSCLQKCELKQRKANGYDDVLVDFVVWARLQEIFLAKVAFSNFFLQTNFTRRGGYLGSPKMLSFCQILTWILWKGCWNERASALTLFPLCKDTCYDRDSISRDKA